MKQKKSRCKRDYIAAFNYSCNLKCVALMYGFKKQMPKSPVASPARSINITLLWPSAIRLLPIILSFL